MMRPLFGTRVAEPATKSLSGLTQSERSMVLRVLRVRVLVQQLLLLLTLLLLLLLLLYRCTMSKQSDT